MDMASPSSLLQPFRFTTADLPPEQRFDSWREHMSPVAELTPSVNQPATGAVDLAIWDLGTLALCQERNPGACFARTPKRVRATLADHWYLFLLKSGNNWTISDCGASERISRGASGQLGFYSLGEACYGEMRDIETLMLFMPRDVFPNIAGQLDRISNSMLDTPCGGLLTDYLLALERRLPSMRHEDLPAVRRATEAMITACLVPTPPNAEQAREGLMISLGERARCAVHARLADPNLTPASLALSIGVSRSVLYRLFEPLGGVACYIRNCRLAAARRAIVNSSDLRRIHQIAEACGFSSSQEFSRAFRHRYGYSPSEARAELGGLITSSSFAPGAECPRTLAEFLLATA
ncbi:AraC family transcriptional regulator [Rhodopseudomonas faecalis]|uniref:AraC family transcriptional regulator n=1 Tax=Rhodopseudomonas faecalis TaxID=99655 RepID=A0A318TPW1_9BRAD|nr:AraC family transcriptional regulator [Rhodopseudomonas faecalis]